PSSEITIPEHREYHVPISTESERSGNIVHHFFHFCFGFHEIYCVDNEYDREIPAFDGLDILEETLIRTAEYMIVVGHVYDQVAACNDVVCFFRVPLVDGVYRR